MKPATLLTLLALAICGSCARPGVIIPMRWRPDTRAIQGVRIELPAFEQMMQVLQTSLPNEGAVCFFGVVKDTVLDDVPRRLGIVRHVEPVVAESVTVDHVYFAGNAIGCATPGLIGGAHSHPYSAEPAPCAHSDDDANVVFVDRRVLFSIVVCGDGRLEVMYQDGRRFSSRWKPAP